MFPQRVTRGHAAGVGRRGGKPAKRLLTATPFNHEVEVEVSDRPEEGRGGKVEERGGGGRATGMKGVGLLGRGLNPPVSGPGGEEAE